jgi:hypothetical protein
VRVSPTESIEIACEVRRHTDKALLIYDGAREVWIARSQISDQVEEQGLIGKRITSIFIPVWLATEKGLI